VLPAPSAVIHCIASGRTTKRDKIGKLANASHVRGLRFILNCNHSCNSGDGPVRGALSLLSHRGQVPAGREPARDPSRAQRALRLPLGWLVIRQLLFARHTRRSQHRHHGNARLRIDACIKLKFLVSAADVDFKGDESNLCISLGEIIAF
jgi:hypothetical protein